MNFLDHTELSDEQLYHLAKIDMSIPALYDLGFIMDETLINERVNFFKTLPSPCFFQIAFIKEEIVAFHCLTFFQTDLARGAKIITLWTHPDQRGKGLAKVLKAKGIEWAKKEKLEFIQTGVHSNNTRMLEINKKNGFEEFSVTMRLKL